MPPEEAEVPRVHGWLKSDVHPYRIHGGFMIERACCMEAVSTCLPCPGLTREPRGASGDPLQPDPEK
ncbi:MAG: hypothetical protein CMJ67_05105 [Planctomycetaceae bacterium]|nr:hypothetical protein [Planctomycetaceae bacterium]